MTKMFIKASCMVALLVIVLTVTVPKVEALTCGQVVAAIAPCLGYLGNGGTPPPVCCNGIRGLRNQLRTTADRKAMCTCIKSASSSYYGVSAGNAASLPGKCGVNLPYKITPSIDCNKIR